MANHPHNKDRPEMAAVKKALAKGDMTALAQALSHRQRRFAEEYIVDYNGCAAALRAGYSINYPDRQAHILLKHKGVIAYIDHLSRSKESKIISVNPEYVIQKVTSTIEKAEGTNNLTAVLRACELLARHLGMLTDKTEITGKDGGAIELEQRVKEEMADFTLQLKQLVDRTKKDMEVLEL
jgi:hypothetical protein